MQIEQDIPANRLLPAASAESTEPISLPLAAAKPTTMLAATSTLALAACGGGGGSEGDSETDAASAASTIVLKPDDAHAARFLAQASFAATEPGLARLRRISFSAWLDEQMAQPMAGPSHFDWLLANGYNSTANSINNSIDGLQRSVWRQLITAPDVLRQRIVLALTEIFVISIASLPVNWRQFAGAAYLDMLGQRCFGTYRDLLEGVTLSNAMGVYLNMKGNQKEDAKTGRMPDENYAREVLQLFSIGLLKLNESGQPVDANGRVAAEAGTKPAETYVQEDITNLAKVFTGWDFDSYSATDPSFMRLPMKFNPARHSILAKSFLPYSATQPTIPAIAKADAATGPAELKIALDKIANHPNVGPFIGRQLIQRLVTSNPSPGYVGRVAAAFNDNGHGVRGDLKAVIKAVLLDVEARTPEPNTDPEWGKLREPLVRFIQWARTFKANTTAAASAAPDGLQWKIGDTSDARSRLGMSPLRSPTVFNFFRPGYVPPNTAAAQAGLVAPEFQLANETSVIGYLNYMTGVVANGASDVKPDYSAELAVATDTAQLVARVALLLTGNTLSDTVVKKITDVVTALPAATDANKLVRVQTAILLVLACPQYLIQK